MKQILKPSSKEESIHFSDFNGIVLDSLPVTIKIECNYGSYMDGLSAELHLTDEEARALLLYIKSNMTPESIKSNNEFWNEVV